MDGFVRLVTRTAVDRQESGVWNFSQEESMSAVLETSHESKQIKHEAGAQQVKIDPATTLFKPWALKAMSVMRVQEAWRLKK